MFCPECGQQTKDGTKFCGACGTKLGSASKSMDAAGGAIYAGFWRRYAAVMADITVFCLLCGPIFVYDLTHELTNDFYYGFIASPLIIGFYSVLGEGLWGATPGKFAAGIKVTNEEGERIGTGRAAVRLGVKLAMAATLGLSFVMAAFQEKRRAPDDMAAGSLVVSAKASPADIARAPSATMPLSALIIAEAALFTMTVPLCFVLMAGLLDAVSISPYPPERLRGHIMDMRELYGTQETDNAVITESAPGPGGGDAGDIP